MALGTNKLEIIIVISVQFVEYGYCMIHIVTCVRESTSGYVVQHEIIPYTVKTSDEFLDFKPRFENNGMYQSFLSPINESKIYCNNESIGRTLFPKSVQ